MAGKTPSNAGYDRCPICGDKTETAYRPFCSARCRDVDLARWLGGGYAIPGGRAEADEDGADADPLGARDDRRRDGGDDEA
jgi:endogenous inhibitor of DNA gyrase (YacG/DUF329 family)